MNELMEMLYDWDENRSFLTVELHRLELVQNGGEVHNEETLSSMVQNFCQTEVMPREDAITRLFDLDLFGWQLKSYTWLNGASGWSRLKVEVYRRES